MMVMVIDYDDDYDDDDRWREGDVGEMMRVIVIDDEADGKW